MDYCFLCQYNGGRAACYLCLWAVYYAFLFWIR